MQGAPHGKDGTRTVGLLTTDTLGSHHRYRVSVDGVDVSDRCFSADDRHGWAACYKRDGEGNFYLTWPRCGHKMRLANCECATFVQHVVAEVLVGDVEIARVVTSETTGGPSDVRSGQLPEPA